MSENKTTEDKAKEYAQRFQFPFQEVAIKAYLAGAAGNSGEEKWDDKTIDTIGKCANCGVEFHIHKNEASGTNRFVKATLRLPSKSDIYFCKEDRGGLIGYYVCVFDGEIFTSIEKHDIGVKILNKEWTTWLDESNSPSQSDEEIAQLNKQLEFEKNIKEQWKVQIDELKKEVAKWKENSEAYYDANNHYKKTILELQEKIKILQHWPS